MSRLLDLRLWTTVHLALEEAAVEVHRHQFVMALQVGVVEVVERNLSDDDLEVLLDFELKRVAYLGLGMVSLQLLFKNTIN